MKLDTASGRELERLKSLTARQRRGYDFQAFIGSLFREAHFSVVPNARIAHPRQTDLFATRASEAYLVEAKWQAKSAGSPEVQALQRRLEDAPPGVVGVLVSFAGFTKPGVNEAEKKSSRPVLLVSGAELERAVQWSGDFLRLLHNKLTSMTVHGVALIDHAGPPRRQSRPGELPAADETYVSVDGFPMDLIESAGDFGQFVFSREIPDIDWVPGIGAGASLDFQVSRWDGAAIEEMFWDLANLGWVTDGARWSVQQAETNWHGVGAGRFLEVLADWENRYRGHNTHHTEEYVFFDVFEGGFYTVAGQLSADERRVAYRTTFSFQLPGIPLDTEPLRHLATQFDVDADLFFRPRGERSVVRRRLNEGVILDVVGYVVQRHSLGDEDEEWADGLIARNPFVDGAQDWPPSIARDSDLIMCDLISSHLLANPKSTYRLINSESAWTDNAMVLRLAADWDNEPEDEGGARDAPPVFDDAFLILEPPID